MAAGPLKMGKDPRPKMAEGTPQNRERPLPKTGPGPSERLWREEPRGMLGVVVGGRLRVGHAGSCSLFLAKRPQGVLGRKGRGKPAAKAAGSCSLNLWSQGMLRVVVWVIEGEQGMMGVKSSS